MNILEWTSIVLVASFAAGLLGALTGLGGGVVIVPMLSLFFGVDIRYAIGASLISVIATSSGSAAAYVREGYSNIRIGMFLEIATTLGAVFGAFLAAKIPTSTIAIVFGIILIYSAASSTFQTKEITSNEPTDKMATLLKMNGTYPTAQGEQPYGVRNVPQGFGVMFLAGSISGLLGIGSGAAKVLAMDKVMRIPFKVSTTTSNFMIGVTAATSAGVYLNRGYIDPAIAMPVMLGALLGSTTGARILVKTGTQMLRIIFSIIIVIIAIEMIYNGISGRL